jgi:hypothetical protein
MSCWTNDRGSLVDGFVQSMVLAGVGVVIGVAPTDFAWLVLLGELVQNFSHANVRIRFGPVGDRLLVSPTFHRLHHMVVDPDRPTLHRCGYRFACAARKSQHLGWLFRLVTNRDQQSEPPNGSSRMIVSSRSAPVATRASLQPESSSTARR